MFGFGYLMVPIYDVFCDLTGLNGKTGVASEAQAARLASDDTRTVRVEFMGNRNQNAPLAFAPAVKQMQAHPGRRYQVAYHARNENNAVLVGQAVPSVSPPAAAAHFDKIECFCFDRQPFAAFESRELPLTFIIDPDLPRDIETVTLSYTFFDVTEPHSHDSKTASNL